jgi:hypothetical protein
MNESAGEQKPDGYPSWAPRVTRKEIRQLYETDAKGIYDEDLINEVGFGLLALCESFVDATEAVAGRVRCPGCSGTVERSGGKDEVLRCDCGWELSWGDYFGTIQHKQLSGAEPVIDQFRGFVHTFTTARSPQEKMLAIDKLIHGFHWYLKTGKPSRPVAVNLIEGSLSRVVAFLDRLTYGNDSTPGLEESYSRWNENIEVNRDWYRSRRNVESGDVQKT